MNFKEELNIYSQEINFYLSQCVKGQGIPCELVKAMEYSLLAGGKRIRPILCLIWGKMLGVNFEQILPFACGIELIHTYSLIHDDLPAMDNDDLRRGKPTNHKVFGEALAILAGDGLLTHAFSMMLSTPLPPHLIVSASREIAWASGPAGMVGGQVLDMLYTGKNSLDLKELQKMHRMKTGALIRGSCVSGAILARSAEADDTDEKMAREYGQAIGLAFQIVDDILDIVGNEQELGKPIGSDRDQGKVTYPALLGLTKSRELAEECAQKARASLTRYAGQEKDFLTELAQYIVNRIS